MRKVAGNQRDVPVLHQVEVLGHHVAVEQAHLVVQPLLSRGHPAQLLELGPHSTQLVLEVVQRLLRALAFGGVLRWRVHAVPAGGLRRLRRA